MRLARTTLVVAVSLVTLSKGVGAQRSSDTWRTYGGNLQGWRYSELTQIDVDNVAFQDAVLPRPVLEHRIHDTTPCGWRT